MVMNLWVSYKVRNFLTSQVTINFSRRTLLHGVTQLPRITKIVNRMAASISWVYSALIFIININYCLLLSFTCSWTLIHCDMFVHVCVSGTFFFIFMLSLNLMRISDLYWLHLCFEYTYIVTTFVPVPPVCLRLF